ncbi:MAG: hypothetical protein J6D06_00585 [Clostridia bacterium]|nr:hypothetical protein [Clostridia bacterium]
MFLWGLFIALIVIEIIFTPLFLKAQWPQACFKSLIYKMICSTAFVGIGVLSVLISGNDSVYAIMMLVGLGLGWIGDYFLHAKTTNTYFAIGMISFMLGHIAYIACYMRTLPVVSPEYNMFNLVEIVIIAALLVLSYIGAVKFKVEFSMKLLKFGVIAYTAILITMFIKASALGITYYKTGAENGWIALIVLVLGSLCFTLSDATIGLLMFAGKKKNKPLKVFNIVTYFAGQTLLASSILFINA